MLDENVPGWWRVPEAVDRIMALKLCDHVDEWYMVCQHGHWEFQVQERARGRSGASGPSSTTRRSPRPRRQAEPGEVSLGRRLGEASSVADRGGEVGRGDPP